MKKSSYRAKIMLVSLFAALFLMPTGWGGGVSSIATLGPATALAQQGTPIPFGVNIFKQFAACNNESDSFTFQASADDVVVIRLVECIDFNLRCPGDNQRPFEPCIQLGPRAGSPIARNCGDDRARVVQRLPSGDTYSIIINDVDGRGGGRYNLFLQRVNNPGLAEPITSGTELPSEITNCGEVDTYTFEARAGDRVRINMARGAVGNVDPRLELYDPQGRAVAIPNSGSIDQPVTSSGRFTLLAYSSGTQTNSTYRLSLTITPPPPTTLNFPLVFTGQTGEEIRQTRFVFVNTSDMDLRGDLEFFGPDGVTPMEVCIRGVCDVQFPLSIRAGGTQVVETDLVTRPLAQGIAKVTTNVGGIKADVVLRSENQMRQTVFETAYSTPTPTKALTVPVDSVDRNDGQVMNVMNTGLVILNPPPFPGDQPQTAMITLRLVNRQGQPVGNPVMLSVEAGAVPTGPEGEIIRFITDLFKDVPGIEEFQGTILVSSSPVPVSVLAVQKWGDRLTVVPGF
jgi:hypothetical protein